METDDPAGDFDRRIIDNIRFHARRLARRQAIPGMGVGDYQQDLALDLLHRRRAFDPRRATFATFADRLIRHRVSSLTAPTARLRWERRTISLSTPISDDEGIEQTLLDLLPDPKPNLADHAAIRIDVGRFVGNLPVPLVECCQVLLAKSVVEGARDAGLNRSTVYERIQTLRSMASADGLGIYVGRVADRSEPPPVRDGRTVTGTMAPRPPSVRLLITEAELRVWLATAEPGRALTYHRGVLAADRLRQGSRLPEPDRSELDRIASTLLRAAQAGRVHPVQRRHGKDEYEYIAVKGGASRAEDPNSARRGLETVS